MSQTQGGLEAAAMAAQDALQNALESGDAKEAATALDTYQNAWEEYAKDSPAEAVAKTAEDASKAAYDALEDRFGKPFWKALKAALEAADAEARKKAAALWETYKKAAFMKYKTAIRNAKPDDNPWKEDWPKTEAYSLEEYEPAKITENL